MAEPNYRSAAPAKAGAYSEEESGPQGSAVIKVPHGQPDMTSEQLRQIEELFHAVKTGSSEERAALLARADPEVRREVESLLGVQSGNLLDRPVAEVVAQLME